MVSADLVGFHAFDHARHFLNVSKSVLGLISSRTSGRMSLKLNKKSYREILITMSHVSIETNNIDDLIVKNFNQILSKILSNKRLINNKDLNNKENSKKIILSLDVSQRLSGISLKFFGYEKFLLDYFNIEKDKINDILLIQKNIKQNSRKDDEATTSLETKNIIKILKNKFCHLVEKKMTIPSHINDSNKMDIDENEISNSMFSSSTFSIYDESKVDISPPSSPSSQVHPYSPNLYLDSLKLEDDLNEISLIDYEEVNSKNFVLSQRILLYLISDVFLLTPIREGLNLMPLEYLYSRYIFQKKLKEFLKENNINLSSTSEISDVKTGNKNLTLQKELNNNKELLNHLFNPGCVIVSEFSTCASLLNGALKVNPFDSSSISDALLKSINMNRKESEYRRQRDLPFISSHPASLWTKNILCELELFSCNLLKENDHSLRNPFDINNFVDYYKNFNRLSNENNSQLKFMDLSNKVFIFDYGGVILPKSEFGEYKKSSLVAINGKKPSEITLRELKKLSENKENVVLVITGLPREKIITIFKDLPYVTLASTSGFIFSWGKNLQDTSIFSPSSSNSNLLSPTLSNSSSYNAISPYSSTGSLNNTACNMVPSPPIISSNSSSSLPHISSNTFSPPNSSSGMHASISFINSHPFAQSFPSMYFPQSNSNGSRSVSSNHTGYQVNSPLYQQNPQMTYQPMFYPVNPNPALVPYPQPNYFLLPPAPQANLLSDFLTQGLSSSDGRKWEMFPNSIDWFEVRSIAGKF